MNLQPLAEFTYQQGFLDSLPILSKRNANSLARGSRNQMPAGEGFRPWRGFQSKGASSGGRVMFQVGYTWGSLEDTMSANGAGSFFEDIGRSKWFIGAGTPKIEGTALAAGVFASTTLKVSIAVAGVYSLATTYTAGLPQPDPADIAVLATPGAGLVGTINGPISCKIARIRSTTGARSLASLTSAVITPLNNTIRVTFPAAGAGQDYWRIFFTQQGFGGVGLSYALAYDGALDIPESLIAASTVDGVARSLEFNYKDSDLVPELAYIDDYPPPAGTHACRLENVMCVLGCYGDSSSSVSTTASGTAAAISLPNFYESYAPSNLVFFPEPVVDVKGRPNDSYAYVGHRNSITAMQYVGIQNGPAVAVVTIVPDAGIAKPQNWCQVAGLLYMRISKGGFVRMRSDGSLDYEWARPIWNAVKDWDDTTVVTWNPPTMNVVIANGREAYSYSLLDGRWSPVLRSADTSIAGNYLSGVNTMTSDGQGELVVTLDNAGTHTAYSFDKGATVMPITSMTEWRGGFRPSTLFELGVGFETDAVAQPLVYSVHRNLRTTFVTDAVTTSASNTISSATAGWIAQMVGYYICVFGTDVGGAGVNQLIGKIATVAGNNITIVNPSTGAALNAGASLTGAYMLIGYYIDTFTLTRTGPQHTGPLSEVLMPEALSYAVGINLWTGAQTGQVMETACLGTMQNTPVSLTY